MTSTRVSPRRPRGYVGADHETIGSDILAALRVIKSPEQTLGAAEAKRLGAIDPNGWYPIEWLLSVMEKVDAASGHFTLIRLGRTLFELTHQERLLETVHSAREILYGLDDMYRFANRGRDIGGWKVLRFDSGYAELDKTTPHHCVMEQGILAGALAAVGCPSNVTQKQCFREGADSCIFLVSSTVTDARWDPERSRTKPPTMAPPKR